MSSPLRLLHVVGPLLYIAGISADAQEPVPIERAREIAQYLSDGARSLTGTPVSIDADVLRPSAIKAGEAGAMVVPDRRLTEALLASIGDAPVPLGQLFLRHVIPTVNGEPIDQAKLAQVRLEGANPPAEVPIYLLAAQRSSAGELEMLIFGKEGEPLVRVPLEKVSSKSELPIQLTAEKVDDKSGTLSLNVLGAYEAELLLHATAQQQ